MTIAIRVRLLERLMDRIKPIPDDWVIGGRKPNGNANGSGSVEMETLPCESWEELVEVCKKAMKWTEGLDRGFSVCLAAILGTGSVGSQLWIRLIGPPSCLDGDTPIYDPMDGTTKTVKERYELGKRFFVWSKRDDGTMGVAQALPPAVYPPAPMYRVTFKSGTTMDVTEGHRFWDRTSYVSVSDMLRQSGVYRLPTISGDDLEGRKLVEFDEIESIVYLEDREYYDFHVPLLESYWAGNVINHNCGKSTLCEALSTNKTHVKALSTMRGFHSGHRDDSGTNKSVVLELKGKTLITKDADSMVKSPNWPQIMGEARDLFDRVSRTNYRNGMGMDSEGINMTWIMCGTGSGMAGSDMNELGARFVDCIMMEGIDEDLEREINMSVVNRAFKNVKTRSNGTMTTQLNPDMVKMMQMTGGYIEYLHDNAEFLLSNVETDEYVANQIVNLATYSAYLRARPSLKQQEKTEREFSARLVEQYARLAICLAAARGQTTIDKRVLEIVVKCAMDTSSGRTTEIVKYLHEAGDEGLELRALAILTSQSSQEERKLLQFLRKLGAVELWQDKAHGNRMAWRLTPRLSRLYAEVASYG